MRETKEKAMVMFLKSVRCSLLSLLNSNSKSCLVDLNLIAECMWPTALEKRLNFGAIAGISIMGGGIADKIFNNIPSPRGFRVITPQEYEAGRIIAAGEKVLLVDFAFTGIMQDYASALFSKDYAYRDILVFIDIEPENKKKILDDMKCSLYSVFTASQFKDYVNRKA